MRVHEIDVVLPDDPAETLYVSEACCRGAVRDIHLDVQRPRPLPQGVGNDDRAMAATTQVVCQHDGVSLCASHFALREDHQHIHAGSAGWRADEASRGRRSMVGAPGNWKAYDEVRDAMGSFELRSPMRVILRVQVISRS